MQGNLRSFATLLLWLLGLLFLIVMIAAWSWGDPATEIPEYIFFVAILALKPDDRIMFTVRMPPEMNVTNGALIGVTPLREYGAQSAPKFRAWVRLAYLWDAAKIHSGGKRIYATVPQVLRNAEGYLVDAKGNLILTGGLYYTKKKGWKFHQGNMPQRAWYHPLTSRTGEQVRNPQADKVPILSDTKVSTI